MRWKQAQCALVAVLAAAGFAHAQARVVISEIEGGGGLAGAQYDRDFIELFNAGNATQDLTGWSLQVATDATTLVWTTIPLSGTLQPGQYMLVVPVSSRGSTVVQTALPPADLIVQTLELERNLSPTANAVALLSTTPALANGDCPVGRVDLVDFLHYGPSSAVCFQGAGPLPGPSSTPRTVERLDGGCANNPDPLANWATSGPQTPSNRAVNAFTSATFDVPNVTNTAASPVVIRAQRGSSTCNPVGTLTGATADLSAFGLSSTQALNDAGTNGDAAAGDGVFSFGFNVPAGQASARIGVPVTVSSTSGSFPSTAVLQVFAPPATNDACGNEITLTGTGVLFDGLINATQAAADADAGTCNPNDVLLVPNSVWFTYTPSATGGVRVDEQSTEDIIVSVHSSCAGTSTACRQWEVGRYFPVEAGVQVWIQVGLELNQSPQVPYDLTLTFEAAPANDSPCGTLPVVVPGVSYNISENAATTANYDTGIFVSCDQPGSGGLEARRGLWYSLTTGAEPASLFYGETTGNFSVLSVWQAGACSDPNSFVEVGCIEENDGDLGFPLSPNQQYYLLLSLSTFNTIPSEPYAGFIRTEAPPANDTACGATSLGTLPQPISIDASAATHDAGNPGSTCSGSTTTRRYGVWYTYTTGPAQTGGLGILETSSNDIFVTVFTGPDCNSRTLHYCEDNFTSDNILVPVAPSTTYWILVSLTSTSATQAVNGNYELTFTEVPPPSNDLPCNATQVTTSIFSQTLDIRAATHDADVSCNSTTFGNLGVWYRFNVSSPKQLRIEETSTDTAFFALFVGDCNALTEINCKRGSSEQLFDLNTAWFLLEPGVDYFVMVGKIFSGIPAAPYNIETELTDPLGACCSGSSCAISTDADCTGTFVGPGTYCGEVPQFEDPANAPIPDTVGSGSTGTPGELIRTLVAGGPGVVSDLKVLVDITHARLGDLHIFLTAPNGATVDLMRRIDDDTNTSCPNQGIQGHLAILNGVYVFDDQAYSPYGPTMKAAADYFDSTNLFVQPDHYRPSDCNLSDIIINNAIAGSPIAGNWTLTIRDHWRTDVGTLNRWGLIINGGAENPCDQPTDCEIADFNNDGTVQPADIFFFLDAWFAQLCGTPGCGTGGTADIDGNGIIQPADIFFFLDKWFANLGPC